MEKLQGKMESPFIIEMKNVTKIFDGTTVIDKMEKAGGVLNLH